MVNLTACTSADALAKLTISSALDMFRPPAKQLAALIDIAQDAATDPLCCVSSAELGGELVGYASFHPPTDVETWGDDQTGQLVELGAVEVDPTCRGQRLAQRLLEASFEGGRFDDTVVFATMYVWHYDLKRTSLTPYQYKRMLERLYRSIGMEPYRTSDPEIRADPANQLMARVGPNCPTNIKTEFDRLRAQDLLSFSAF
jgi:acetoin utilization protein AcuA